MQNVTAQPQHTPESPRRRAVPIRVKSHAQRTVHFQASPQRLNEASDISFTGRSAPDGNFPQEFQLWENGGVRTVISRGPPRPPGPRTTPGISHPLRYDLFLSSSRPQDLTRPICPRDRGRLANGDCGRSRTRHGHGNIGTPFGADHCHSCCCPCCGMNSLCES